jgi:hypothetical protein
MFCILCKSGQELLLFHLIMKCILLRRLIWVQLRPKINSKWYLGPLKFWFQMSSNSFKKNNFKSWTNYNGIWNKIYIKKKFYYFYDVFMSFFDRVHDIFNWRFATHLLIFTSSNIKYCFYDFEKKNHQFFGQIRTFLWEKNEFLH